MEHLKVKEILQEALKEIDRLTLDSSFEEIQNLRNKYLAKKSPLMTLMATLGTLAPEERKSLGQEINETKNKISFALESKVNEIEKYQLDKKLKNEQIDLSLPGRTYESGAKNPFYLIRDEIIEIFISMGYEVVEGPEVETDENNFTLLNIPQDHPARDMQDSFYINENLLLRTHTSPVQARTMKERSGEPIKVICPGKTYRRDDDDATHSHQFAQVEGLVIDKDISLSDLKGTLELFAKRMFGDKREIRLRSSFFPFTEPSVEVDITCANCGGKGCSMCKGTGYIEILGAGMVHPNVLKINGYDPKEYTGFAFGVGIDRVAILRYGIDDIRRFYQNDVRFLEQFKKKI
ncbi:MAG: phenylalanine--tRNA ligase subunit alpha [Erysipelotrichia bacterium]|nr:phenylalanine--tRNA ligase subunit alpha [Erysipelotrichia bacterium]